MIKLTLKRQGRAWGQEENQPQQERKEGAGSSSKKEQKGMGGMNNYQRLENFFMLFRSIVVIRFYNFNVN